MRSGRGRGGDNSPGGKELDGAVRQQQHDEGEKDAAGVEAPGQQDSRSERGVIVKVNRGRRNRQQPGGQRKHCGKQQYASWHKQGFKRSVGSQFQAGMILWPQSGVNELSSAG